MQIQFYKWPAGLLLVMICQVLSAQPVQPPSAYATGVKVNFIRTWDATAPETDPNALMSRPLKDVKQSTQYFDGLGRPLQTVIKGGSYETNGTATDLVSAVVYDEFGREQFQYLSFPANNTGGNTSISDGLFKMNPFQQQATFMSAQYGGQGETYFYGKTNFEASPLNRVKKSMPAGNSWSGSGRGMSMKYWINTATDGVKIWKAENVTNDFGTYTVTGNYNAGELYKNVTEDEHSKQVIEFKDKEGKVILKKVQLTALPDDGTGSDYNNWLCTYYIYDDLNNLRCVIQPEGVKQLAGSNWQLTATQLSEQCFRYEYDGRNRMVMKKVPGAGAVYMVYDSRDRLVMTQDANMRVGSPVKWMVTKYDGLNRPIETGLWENSGTLSSHQTAAAGAGSDYPTITGNYEELSKTFYDNYDWAASLQSGLKDFSTTYANSYLLAASNLNPPYPQAVLKSMATRGMVTGTKIKVLGTSQYLYSVNFYDEEGRVIQVRSENITNGIDAVTTQYSWAGQPLAVVQKQQKSGTNPQEHVVVTKLEYDDLGRVVRTKKTVSSTINSVAVSKPELELSTVEYDKLGQLKVKKLGKKKDINGSYTTDPIETLTYDYNIRGWMLGMNRPYARDANNTNYFGFDLGYDKQNNNLIGSQTYNASQYNGNITGMLWKSRGDGEKRKYDFSYDAANRLLKAEFTQYNGTVFNQSAGINFDMKMGDGSDVSSSYDYNGNIKRMQQWGLKVNGSFQIDDMLYSYYDGTNKLKAVTEQNGGTTDHKLGDFTDKNNSATDYGYDVNGNMVTDLNKGINGTTGIDLSSGGAVIYNYLNLPQQITVVDGGTTKGTVSYVYDAGGNKLKKVTVENPRTANGNITTTTTTLYIGGMVYETKTDDNTTTTDYTDRLQFISHEEGRIRYKPDDNSYHFDYMLKDHLGNVRMLLTDEQKQDAYPATTLEGTYSSIAPEANSLINTEKKYYTVDNAYVVNRPWSNSSLDYANNNGNPPYNINYPSGASPASSATSAKVYKTNATTNKTGLGIVLKVMAGDKIDIHGKSYYQGSATYNNSNSTTLSLSDLMGSLMGSPDNTGLAQKGINSTMLGTINSGLIPSTFFRGNDGTSSTVPKAYINYLLFDEQFKFVGGDFSRVGASGVIKSHWFDDIQLQGIAVPKNGYLYVYVSNESNADVFFDNLQVFHTRGAILEETHYYPFGLTMVGISSKASSFGDPSNRYKWNVGSELSSKDFSDETGLELYETLYRLLDPQTGRFGQIDPAIDQKSSYSTYESMGNNPISFVDPLGDFETKFGAKWYRFWHGGGTIGQNKYGEWYVTKGEVKENSSGETVATSWRYYGPGRDKYSTARDAILKDFEIENDIMMHGGKKDESGKIIDNGTSLYQFYDSPEDAASAALSYTNLALPNVFIKSATIAINGQKVVEKIKIIFGNNPNQVYHAFRHTDKMGLSRTAVRSIIEKHLPTVVSKIVEGKPLNQIIEVAGKKIQYTAFKLSDGTINVGRIHGVD